MGPRVGCNPPMTTEGQSPYLLGSYAPVDAETDGYCEVIEGEVPRDLEGMLVRNGPNPKFAPRGRYHWFDGDGMLHALSVSDGRVRHRNRWVRTAGLARDEAEGRALWSGLMEGVRDNPRGAPYKDTANTDVVLHAGELKALWYLCGRPYRVDPRTLDTLGPDDFGGTWEGPVSAHAKVDPVTGEMMFMDYGPRPPFMHYAVADASGRLVRRVPIALPGPRLPHDLAVTATRTILMDLPIVFDEKAMAQGRWRTSFDASLPARFAVIPRHGGADDVRWFEAEPCYIYHVVNAWDEGDEVVMVGCRVADPFQPVRPEEGPYAVMMATLRIKAALHRWRFNLRTGKTTEEPLDDRNAEFPSMDRRALGRRSRYAWNVLLGTEPTVFFDGLVKYDTDTGASETLVYGPGRRGSEAPFAPRVGSTAEDDGYVLSLVHDEREDRSELWILDGREPSRGPVARVRIPSRVPLGFHGLWVPGEGVPAAGLRGRGSP